MRLEVNIDVTKRLLRRQNTSVGYKCSGKTEILEGIRIHYALVSWNLFRPSPANHGTPKTTIPKGLKKIEPATDF